MEIRKEIRQINCYTGQNRPKWIVIHETDNYSKGAGALKHSELIKTATCPPQSTGMWMIQWQYRRCITATVLML